MLEPLEPSLMLSVSASMQAFLVWGGEATRGLCFRE
jgi:hypothetical protein